MATSSGNSNGNGNGKRTFKDIRKEILLCLSKGQMTVNEIAVCAKINWKTVNNHLIYLAGRGLVKEVFNSAYVRIYELAEEGKNFLLINVSDKIKIENHKKNASVKTTSIILL